MIKVLSDREVRESASSEPLPVGMAGETIRSTSRVFDWCDDFRGTLTRPPGAQFRSDVMVSHIMGGTTAAWVERGVCGEPPVVYLPGDSMEPWWKWLRRDDARGPLTPDEYDWTVLRRETMGSEVVYVMAATQVDGIGVLATWEKQSDGSWRVRAVDTEQVNDVTDWHEGEPVKPTPPSKALIL